MIVTALLICRILIVAVYAPIAAKMIGLFPPRLAIATNAILQEIRMAINRAFGQQA
jgi:hypothetical protein